MNTDKRLTKAYLDARSRIKVIDNSSKIIIFSDMHRGDDSVSDEFTRNQTILMHALNHYYSLGYHYIEAGDGDELWEYSNFKNIRLAHSDIFTVMKKFYDDNRMTILYGNHNIFLKSSRYVCDNYHQYYDEYAQEHYDLFPRLRVREAVILKYKPTGQEIFIVHGQQGDFMNDQLWPITMLSLRYFWRYLHVIGFHNPVSPAKNLYKRHRLETKYSRWIQRHKKMLICGHTHRPAFPKNGELPYFNTGCCIRTKGITGIEICNGEIMLVDWRISASKEGSMYIKRTIVRGPVKIAEFIVQ